MYQWFTPACTCNAVLMRNSRCGFFKDRIFVSRKYFKVKPDSNLMWSLIEQSVDETGKPRASFDVPHSIQLGPDSMHLRPNSIHYNIVCSVGQKSWLTSFSLSLSLFTVYRMLDPNEDPSQVVDFWGKSRVRERNISQHTELS